MPIIPRISRQVAPDPLPGVRKSPGAPEGAFGGPRVPDTSGVANAALRIAEDAKRQGDEHAYLAADRALFDLRQGIAEPVLSAQGTNAMSAAAGYQDRFAQGADKVLANAGNDDQRAAIQRRIEAHREALTMDVERHVHVEDLNGFTQEIAAGRQNRLADAVAHADDPAYIQRSIDESAALTKSLAQRTGMGPEALSQQIAEDTSKIHVGVLTRMIDNGQDLAAQQYFAKVSDKVVGTDRGPIERLLERGSVLGEGQRQSDAIMQSATTLDGALQQARQITDPRVREETEKGVRQRYEDKAAGEREAEHAAYEQAAQLIEKGQAVPLSMRLAMGADHAAALERRQDYKRRKAAGVEPSDPDTIGALRNMAFLSPQTRQQFATLDLAQFAGDLNKADMKWLVTEQNRALSERVHGEARTETAEQKATRKRAEAIATAEAMGLHIPTAKAAPGGPLHVPTAPPPAVGQPAAQPTGGIGQQRLPSAWVEHAKRDPHYRQYLVNMGYTVPDQPTP